MSQNSGRKRRIPADAWVGFVGWYGGVHSLPAQTLYQPASPPPEYSILLQNDHPLCFPVGWADVFTYLSNMPMLKHFVMWLAERNTIPSKFPVALDVLVGEGLIVSGPQGLENESLTGLRCKHTGAQYATRNIPETDTMFVTVSKLVHLPPAPAELLDVECGVPFGVWKTVEMSARENMPLADTLRSISDLFGYDHDELRHDTLVYLPSLVRSHAVFLDAV